MKKLDLITLPAYEFLASKDLVDEILKELKTLEYINNKSNSLSKNFYNKNLFNWFDDCLEQVKKLYFKQDLKLEITDCWVNATKKFESHHEHTHSNSIVSGIFYLTNNPTSETIFYYKNPWSFLDDTGFMEICNTNPKNIRCKTFVKPLVGRLLLFPSHIEHSVKVNTENQDRYTISFNTFISGKISDQNTKKLSISVLKSNE